jgi:peptide/nickel transport system permease protein
LPFGLSIKRLMWSLTMRRFCALPLLLLLAGLCGATLLRFAPGFDVDERELDARASAESLARFREARSADRNILAYYGRFLAGALSGDLGVSRSLERPVVELVRERLPVTARLVGYGVPAAWIAGLGCALCAALWPRGFVFDLAGTVASCVLLSLPAALIGILFLYWPGPLPLALGLLMFPRIFIYARNLVESAQAMPHVVQAQARGLSPAAILFRHVVPPALPQLGSLAAVSVSFALGAAIPLEVLCDRPGIGQLAWQAALGRDLPLLVGLTLVMALVVMSVNMVSDIANAALRRQP